jgi:hypothetical protein
MFLNDLRFGIRLLYKNPGFTFAAVITLAMGTALTATMLSVTAILFLSGLLASYIPEIYKFSFISRRGV